MNQSSRSPINASLLMAATIICSCIYSQSSYVVDAFSPARSIANVQRVQNLHQSKIIDAEVIPEDELNSATTTITAAATASPTTLIEYSQNQDPEWKSMPVAFCDNDSNTYIDCNLAFYVKDPFGDDENGAEYALGVPCDVPIVVALEEEDNDNERSGAGSSSEDAVTNLLKVLPINPDDDNSSGGGGAVIMKDEEKEEIFQMAARALMDEFGPQIRLKKTPRTLTMEGDLEAVIGDWKDVLLGAVSEGGSKDTVTFEEALAADEEGEDDDEEDFFDTIMKRDLGPDYMKLVDDDDEDEIDGELLKMFSADDLDEDLDDLMDDISAKEDKIKQGSYEELVQRLQPSAALKLLNFLGPGGKEYTILRPLRPILLVGKEDPDDFTRRILLSEEERETILPRLENACREGLEEAGYFLSGSNNEDDSVAP